MKVQRIIFETIVVLFICLWGYAAFSKIFEYEIFKGQLAKSPLLESTAGFVAIFLPAIEIVLALMLIFDRTKCAGILASLALMTIFTVYLIGILTFSKDVPCSCGGILQNMTWTQHIYFNIGFVLLAIVALIIVKKTIWGQNFRRLVRG
ncbi:MauE/DoxX family redox-associated membrane protein [Chitinophaga niabensis]|uniref:Methylamine utilisation protein MauE n=1 Tax=Chitinophaga niabensis TaxID=536979 RepID=A0A1N6E3E6_9BACT|nr:MauE/DoxX family redox-associated membrane protein [Chitinophaga niabensis]SIN77550.1 Methylamine utilisation protein MauE [Chitinophaga niabensis]